MDYQILNLQLCPRCEYRSYEMLETHEYCVNCNYSPDFHAEPMLPIPQWARDVFDGIDSESTVPFEEEIHSLAA